MSRLTVTLIDVGWGDSILLEAEDAGATRYALIDSNDTAEERSSYIFLRRHFARHKVDLESKTPIFDFVLLSHDHADHGQGLKALIRAFGTRELWYSKTEKPGILPDLQAYGARFPQKIEHMQAVDSTKILPAFGAADMKVLWPPRNVIDAENENNNSVVLSLRLGNVVFLLTGDAEERVWQQIAAHIPPETQFFKVPHHGSVNGTFGAGESTPWLDNCPVVAKLGISAHGVRFHHPHDKVIHLFETAGREHYRTDRHFHLVFSTDGTATSVQYSRV